MKRLYNVLVYVFTAASFLVGVTVILYLCINIIKTSYGLEQINSEIRSELDYAGTLHGYTDTTGIDEHIEELFEQRREQYYNSENPFVRKFSTQSSLVKFLLCILAVFVVVLFIIIIIVMIYNVLKSFSRFLTRPFRRR